MRTKRKSMNIRKSWRQETFAVAAVHVARPAEEKAQAPPLNHNFENIYLQKVVFHVIFSLRASRERRALLFFAKTFIFYKNFKKKKGRLFLEKTAKFVF